MLKHSKLLDTLIKYGIAAILIAVPIFPKFPFLNVPGIYVSVRIEDFLILVVTILWFTKNLKNLLNLMNNPIIRAIILFLVTGFLATFIGIILLHTAGIVIGFLEWARRVEYLICFVIALTSIKSTKDVEFYTKCIGIVIVIVFVFGVGQKYFGWPVITTQNQEYSKGIALRYVPGTQLVSTFAGHYDLASFMLITTPVFVCLFFATKKTLQEMFGNINDKFIRALILVLIAMSFWLMINAASRITAVAYILAVAISLFLIRKYKYIIVAIIATLIFTFSTSNLFDRYLNIFNVIKSKLMGLIPVAYAQSNSPMPPAPLQDLSTSIRLNVEWPRAIRAFLKSPLLGTGYSSTTLATDNDYLRSLGEVGILGTIAFFFVFFRIIKSLVAKAWSKRNLDFRTVFVAGIIGAIPASLLNAVFIDIFEASKFAITFWFLVGFAVAVTKSKE